MTTPSHSTLGRLRALTPLRSNITYDESLRIAELQACRLTEHLDVSARDLGEEHIKGLPRITVVYEELPVSGMSHWNGQTWVIALNGLFTIQGVAVV